MTHTITTDGNIILTLTASEAIEIYDSIIERKLDPPIIPLVSALANMVNRVTRIQQGA